MSCRTNETSSSSSSVSCRFVSWRPFPCDNNLSSLHILLCYHEGQVTVQAEVRQGPHCADGQVRTCWLLGQVAASQVEDGWALPAFPTVVTGIWVCLLCLTFLSRSLLIFGFKCFCQMSLQLAKNQHLLWRGWGYCQTGRWMDRQCNCIISFP